jgi:PAS domain-containing protein
MKKIRSIGLRYGIAIVAFATPILIAYGLSHFWKIRFDSTFLLVLVLIGSSWFGGRGPGLTVAILMVLAYNLLPPPAFTLRFAWIDVTRIVLLIPLSLFVSGRRRAETLINRQREWLSVTLSSIGDAVIATDINGIVTFINPTAEMLTGWTSATALGKTIG